MDDEKLAELIRERKKQKILREYRIQRLRDAARSKTNSEKQRRKRNKQMQDLKNAKKGIPPDPNSAWKKNGVSPNPNGRPKGTKNQFSKRLKERIACAMEVALLNLEPDFESMKPIERVKALSLFAKYFIAEKKAIEKKVEKISKIEVSFADDYNVIPISNSTEHEAIEYEEPEDEEDEN